MTKEKIGAEEIYLAPEKNTSAEANKALVDEVLKAENTVKVRDNLKKNIRVCEIPELRERNRKVFKMSDGTEQAVFYSESVHVFDEDTNSFDEVDTTIVKQEDGRHFVCGKNHFVAKFSNEEENDELFLIESGMHRVSVSAKKSKKNINNGKKPLLRKKRPIHLYLKA